MIYKEAINSAVDRFGDVIGTICSRGGEIRYEDLSRQANQLAHFLLEAGVVKGDKVGILAGNAYHYRQLFWAAGRTGFVLIPVNARLHPGELAYIIDNSEAETIIISEEFAQVIYEIRDRIPRVKRFYTFDKGVSGFEWIGDKINDYPVDDPKVDLNSDDLLWFQYTSGTTGLPKGAMLTQGNAASILSICYEAIHQKGLFHPGTRALQLLPSYSFSSIAFDIMYQHIGAVTVIMDQFDVNRMQHLIESHRITDCHIVPVILNFMLNSPEFGKYDLSSLECITYGAAPMPVPLLRQGIERIGRIFMQDYGCSEAGALTFLDIEDHVLDGPPELTDRLKSCGKPIPGVSVKVLNEEDLEIKPGEIGELTTKSDMVMKGYWKMPEESAASLRDGRFYTGDLCTVDSEGYIYIKDRKKDMIISGGFNIYPFEIESVLTAHPAVKDAAVIGVPDDTWGESVCAHVVKHQGQSVSEADLIEYVKDNLAGYKKPKYIHFVQEIPRTMTGKILKRQLRETYWTGRDRKV